jgi:hypothetical protein
VKHVRNSPGLRLLMIGEPFRPNPFRSRDFDMILGNWEMAPNREYFFPIMFQNLAFLYQDRKEVHSMTNLSNHAIFRKIEAATQEENLSLKSRINGFAMINRDCAVGPRYKGFNQCSLFFNRREVKRVFSLSPIFVFMN